MGLKDLIPEGDALQMVNILSKNDTNLSQRGLLIVEAKILLHTFARWSVNYTKREANMAAHLSTKEAISLQEDMYGIEETPICLLSTVLIENLKTF